MFKSIFKKLSMSKEDIDKRIDECVLMLNGDTKHDKYLHTEIQCLINKLGEC